jgi:GAF domain-containing protein
LADDEATGSLSYRLSRVLLAETKLDYALALVVDIAKQMIPGAASVSVTLVHDERMATPASSDPTASSLDLVQYQEGAGPCVHSARLGSEVNASDLAHDGRWPHVQAQALALGIGSVLCVPLILKGASLGALNVYACDPEGLPLAGMEQARQLADQATVLLANVQAFHRSEERNEQLREALASRDVIGQAKGILMEREGVSSDQAFDILRKASQRSNVKLRELAEQLTQPRQRGSKTGS